MMYLKVNKPDAEGAKRAILKHALLDRSRLVQHEDRVTYFPIIDNISKANIKKLLKEIDFSIVNRTDAFRPMQDYHTLVRNKLANIKIDVGYDALGSIAIVDNRDGHEIGVLKKLASCILESNPRIKTVLSKAGPVKGAFRIRSHHYIAGERKYTADYKENGTRYVFDVRRTFFSTRLAFERLRIAKLSTNKENVAILFAGIGPFAIQIAALHPHSHIIAIELNSYACKNMERNIKLNKTPNVLPVEGDVIDISKKYPSFADRIVMPLPKTSITFLDQSFYMAKKKCVVHLYAFVAIDGGEEELINKIKYHAKKNRYKVNILSTRLVRPYSAHEEEVVVDYKIFK